MDDSADIRLSRLETEVAKINQRNSRVEVHKAWETSRTRLLSITTVTYITMVLVFWMLGSQRPYFDALVPTTGFFLSTLPLRALRKHWEERAAERKPE